MAQPSTKLALKAANAAEYFYYAHPDGMWDAKNSVLLVKTGTAGMAVESGANVALANNATTYALPSEVDLLTGDWTVIFRARLATGSSDKGMVCGLPGVSTDFIWLNDGSGNCKIRCIGGTYTLGASPAANTSTIITVVRDQTAQTFKYYKDGALIGSAVSTAGSGVLPFKIAQLLNGYTGTSMSLSGSLEMFSVIPSKLDSAAIAARTADLYAVLETAASNNPPTFTGSAIGNQAATVGTAFSLNVAPKFTDTDALTFTLVGTLPAGMTLSAAGLLSGTPTTAQTASSLQVRATDTAGQSVLSDTFSITVSAAAGAGGTAPGSNLNSGSTITPGTATGGTAGVVSFTSKPLSNNTGSGPRTNAAVAWEWRVGAGFGVAPGSVTYGTGTTGADGSLVASGMPAGPGMILIETTDRLHRFTQRGTAA